MSRYIPTKDTLRQKKLKWMNFLCHAHDIHCDCANPLECTVVLIFNQEKELKFRPPERDLIIKCVTGEETRTDGDAVDQDIIGKEDLDALFGDDFGDTDTG